MCVWWYFVLKHTWNIFITKIISNQNIHEFKEIGKQEEEEEEKKQEILKKNKSKNIYRLKWIKFSLK